jgi:uncharacterized protein YggE
MEQNSQTLFGEKLNKTLVILVMIASVFLLAKTAKEIKLYKYVGRDVPATNQINVTGTGEAMAIPDVATFTFTVRSDSKTVEEAQKTVTDKISAILDFLKKEGVAEKDIKTVSYNINPKYDYKPCYTSWCPPYDSNRNLSGYEVSEYIEVKVRDLDNAGSLVTGIGALGVTDLSGLSFMVDDEEAVKAEARAKAIADAKAKAKILAKDLGVDLSRIVSFSESSGNYPPYYYGKAMGMGGAEASADLAVAELPKGENKYTVNVYINYEIR